MNVVHKANEFNSRQYCIKLPVPERIFEFELEYAHKDWGREILHEPEVCDAMGRFVQPGDYVIDAGANIGFFTLLLSQLVGEEGAVVGLEPDRNCYMMLRKNVERNKCTNVGLGRHALWSCDCKIPFWLVEEKSGYSSFQRFKESTTSTVVLARALDTLLPNCHPRLIKLDCEGAEGHILRGAEKMLRYGVDCVIAEFNFYLMENFRFDYSERDMREFMAGLGYDCFVLEQGYKPMHIPLEVELKSNDGLPVNVMFSTVDKVNRLWEN